MAKAKKSRELSKVDKESCEKSRNKSGGLATFSLLIVIWDKLVDFIYSAIGKGVFGKSVTAYSAVQNSFSKGLCGFAMFGNHKIRRLYKTVRRFLAEKIESSVSLALSKKIIKFLCTAPLNFYGNFFFFFGVYTIVIYLVKRFIPGIGTADLSYLIVGIITTVLSLPLLLSKISIADAIKKSYFGNLLFTEAFGFSDETFNNKLVPSKGKSWIMLLIGLAVGLLTFFVSPLSVLGAIFLLIVAVIIAVAPEIGIFISIVLLPFFVFLPYGTISLRFLIVDTAFFYLLKLVRGKRTFKLELSDTFVLLFGLVILFSGAFSAGGVITHENAVTLTIFLCCYFLIVNLMKTEKWATRCAIAFVTSATVSALLSVVSYLLKITDNSFLSFVDGKTRMFSIFSIVALPLALAAVKLSKEKNQKRLARLSCFILVSSVIITVQFDFILALVISALVFYMFYNKKASRVFLLAVFVIPILPLLLPEFFFDFIWNSTFASGSSLMDKVKVWDGVIDAAKNYILSGVGFGNKAFSEVYPFYATADNASVAQGYSFVLQMLLSVGVIGCLVFCVAMFFVAQKLFEYIKKPENKNSKVYVIAIVSSICGAFALGIFEYIWYDFEIFCAFWIIAAIGCAFVRAGNAEQSRKADILDEYEKIDITERN